MQLYQRGGQSHLFKGKTCWENSLFKKWGEERTRREHCKGAWLSWQPELACCQRGENSAPLVISHSHKLSLLSQSHCPQTCPLSIHRLPCFLLFWNPGTRRQRRKSGFVGFLVPALSRPFETGRRRSWHRSSTLSSSSGPSAVSPAPRSAASCCPGYSAWIVVLFFRNLFSAFAISKIAVFHQLSPSISSKNKTKHIVYTL